MGADELNRLLGQLQRSSNALLLPAPGKNSSADLETRAEIVTIPVSPTLKSKPEEAAMAMTNAERQQRYRDRVKRDRADAVTRALVPSRADFVTPATVAAPQAIPAMVSEAAPVDLEALHRDIMEWIKLQATVNNAEAQDRKIRRRDRIAQLTLLIIAVGFYALIAYSAINR